MDVGANCGQTLMDYFAAPVTASYFGFEPNHHCVSALVDIVRVNGRSDCSVIPAGLADENAIRKLLLEKDSIVDSSASIEIGLRPDREWAVQFVACYTFDAIRQSIGIGEISLIKIDVEGAELSTLRGMQETLKEGCWILCEVLHRDSRADARAFASRMNDLMTLIGGLGYICLKIEKSDDGSAVRGLVKMAEFPNKIWTWDNASECDYMFVPAQDSDLVSRLFAT
ncbi:FkbM family methyltransferase [Bradyrhizobium sp. SYSU BS000235]|uniref:FkbM family methyltransferase n=1 Tax=Bradyrhizobium sp. SYSU BS000235 TaxID=3411332 RepID=UPI003C77F9F7